MEVIDQVYACMATERVNCDIIFIEEENQGVFINIRLRPWKGGRRADSMVLAGGRTLDEALYYAYSALFQGLYIPQDWSARTLSRGYVAESGQTSPGKNAPRRPTFDATASFGAVVGPGVDSQENGAQESSEEHTGPVLVIKRNMPKN